MPAVINLPFDGFYDSKWSSELDHQEEQTAEYEYERQEEEGVPPELRLDQNEIAELLMRHSSYDIGFRYIAEQYVAEVDHYLSQWLGFPLGFKFEAMDSPKFYNFETDRVFAYVEPETVARLFALSQEDQHQALKAKIQERFTSRDGFISGYRNTLETWLAKPIENWDHNELGTLLLACLDLRATDCPDDPKQWDWAIFENMYEDFYTAIDRQTDWTAFEASMKEAREDKEAELRAEDPDYVAPAYRCPFTLDLFARQP